MQKTVGIIFGLFFVLGFSAQNVKVNCTAKSFVGKYAYLHVYTDYLTMNYKTLDRALIKEDGSFQFEAQIDEIVEATIQITDRSGIVYLDPLTKEYNIGFPSPEEKDGYNGKNAILTLDGLDKDEVNLLILDYEYRLSGFLYGSYENEGNDSTWNLADLILHPETKGKLDKFKKECKEAYKEVDNNYFHQYVQYSIAGFEQFTGGMKDIEINKAQVYMSYINGKPLQYRNSSYMFFLFDFYEKPFRMLGAESYSASTIVINEYQSYTKLLNLMRKEFYFKDNQVSELIMMKSILEEYHSPTYTKEGLLTILDSVVKVSDYPENRKIAENVYHLLTRLEKGFRVPDFNLITTKGDTINLDSLAGKHIYLDFFHTESLPALSEKILTIDLLERYGEYVEFVSICLDENEENLTQFLKDNLKYTWKFASYKGDVSLLDMYNIRTLPTYFLIGPDGKMVDANPARPSPSNPGAEYTTIDKTFFYIKKKLAKKQKFNVGIR